MDGPLAPIGFAVDHVCRTQAARLDGEEAWDGALPCRNEHVKRVLVDQLDNDLGFLLSNPVLLRDGLGQLAARHDRNKFDQV